MKTPDALAVLRSLDALPVPRRQHLAVLVATAPSDDERARLIWFARQENRHARDAVETDLRAELSLRDQYAARNPPRPIEASQARPNARSKVEGLGNPEPRPVVITFTTPTKTGPAPEPVRPMFAKKDASAAQKDKPEPEHGTLSRYQNFRCKCARCRDAKRQSYLRYKARLRERMNSDSQTN